MTFELFSNVLVYLKSEIDTLLAAKSDTSHGHAHTSLSDVSADQHHAQSHTHASHSDIGANDHHAQSHMLATDAALGGDHTITGGVAGYVLRALSATTAKFMQLAHADLGSVTADQHHAQAHTLASHSTKAHSELSTIGADDHHAKAHNHSSAAEGGNLGALAADLNLNTHKATGMTAGAAATDGANLGQVRSAIIGGFNGGTIAASTTSFMNFVAAAINAAFAAAAVSIPYAGVVRNLYVTTTGAQPANNSMVCALYINNAASGLTVTVTAGAAAQVWSDTTHSAAVTAGDRISLRCQNNANLASAGIGGIAVEVDLI